MATIVLSAAGTALGTSLGGSVMGLSMATIGRAAGAALGRVIDERLLGLGSDPVETGRVDRFRLTGASEGAAVGQVFGRMRVPGQVIWASPFVEHTRTDGGGKGSYRGGGQTRFSYSVNLAVALCEGEITRVGRVWADGQEVSRDQLGLRVYAGREDQGPDPKMEAVEGAGRVPAYRGIAYVVFEDLDLAPYGNRVPQFTFEVFRPATVDDPATAEDIAHLLRGVALIPGTGEYALATTPVYLSRAYGETVPANINSPSGKSDFLTSIDALTEELPNCGSVSLVVSWFGDDLRAGACALRPKVEQQEADGTEMPWRVSGLDRGAAGLVAQVDDRPVYGGTPADDAVVEAIADLTQRGKDVVFYPFILMEQMAGNSLPDPWSGAVGQPALPWRGRITTDRAPGVVGSTDGTAAAEAEVAAFFGTAAPSDFAVVDGQVVYSGPDDWGLRRFILHYAFLCQAAGGVSAFCIGSEMVALTQIRGAGGSFPAVEAFRVLASETKAILGPSCKIGYAADWSEYHGYQPIGSADKLFHLDPLWADPALDFIGIDNYMPLSDWRDGAVHADADAGTIYDLDYLTGNVAGGELFDWYYATDADRETQIRTPITDGDGEPWVWRVKDLRGWWENPHHERIGGVRETVPTAWQPMSKPIWFTELGCAAIDKGTNQPNKFLDPKSSESALPYYSSGSRDDYIQMQYLRAVHRHFADPVSNPVSVHYGGPMVDMSRAHVWTWDTRPWPAFPSNAEVWSDGANYMRGHWLNGRSASRSLASVVAELCAQSGVGPVDTGRLHGLVRGFRIDEANSARASLQMLMVAFGFDAVERDGVLHFVTRTGLADHVIEPGRVAVNPEVDATIETSRAAEAEVAGRVRLVNVDGESDYDLAVTEARHPGDASAMVSQTELPMALTRGEGRRIAERWLAEARVAREGLRLSLPPSASRIGAGDVIRLATDPATTGWRIDRLEEIGQRPIEAVRVEPEVYRPHRADEDAVVPRRFALPVPVEAVFLDLPLLKGDESPVAPHVALVGSPWPGRVALYSSATDSGFDLNRIVRGPSVIGTTETEMTTRRSGLWDRGPALRVRLVQGALSSASHTEVLQGRNIAAIGDGSQENWEVFQFAEAELIAPQTWDLRLRLRGQVGTDGNQPAVWPAGSVFVLLDGDPQQIDLAPARRGIERHYRWGPAAQPLDHPAYQERVLAFEGIGLRPYSVCHLRSTRQNGDDAFTWTRRTRIDGDGWSGADVPLGEDGEAYRVTAIAAGQAVREATVSATSWAYPASERAADGVLGAYRVEVSQVSVRFGPGAVAGIDVPG